MSIAKTLSFVAVDVETTGLNKETDEIIELAAIRFVNGEYKERYTTFIKPRNKVPKFIQHLTNITPKMLQDAPDRDTALKQFKNFVGKDIIIGHNLSFDMGFINYGLEMMGDFPLINDTIDTLEISRIFVPFMRNHKLGTMIDRFGLELENAHRADADAKATGELYVKLAEYVVERFTMLETGRLEGFAKISESPAIGFFKQILSYQRLYAVSAPPLIQEKSPFFNIISNERPAARELKIEEVFCEDGLFADRFTNFEYRQGQLKMAERVREVFEEEKHLLVEAGTGIGKSFAYLVPALDFSRKGKSRVVVSTNTKNLQEQLFYKDLPTLKEILPIPFKAVLIKGRENYICERRWQEQISQKEFTVWDAQALLYLWIWKKQTETGDISENSSFDRNRFSGTWRKICSDRYMCGGRKCPFYSSCYVMRLRREAENSSIVVANHALLIADMQMENSTLGEYEYLVIDEAHNLMNAASKHLGHSISYIDLSLLFNQFSKDDRRQKSSFLGLFEQGLQRSVLSEEKKNQCLSQIKAIAELADRCKVPALELFSLAANRCTAANSWNKLRIKAKEEMPDLFAMMASFMLLFKELINSVQALVNIISSLESAQLADYDQYLETSTALLTRLSEMEGVLLAIVNADFENFALWIENTFRADRNIPASSLNYAPIEVNSCLYNLLYKQVSSIILTSATLSLRGSFRYFINQSGLNLLEEGKLVELNVESPFDYDNQSKLLVASFLPIPTDPYFKDQANSCLRQIFNTVDEGTMVLFTSYQDLDAVYDEVSDELYQADRTILAQGKGNNRSGMLQEFSRLKNAVLLGTASFWEGVDVQGDSLSLLILYKIPFQVPSEPLVEAYLDKLTRENKDSFMHYILPNALLKLRQGFGRLIRSKNDRGIVLIMDSRVTRKAYGKYFMEVLPAEGIKLKDDLMMINEITRFFSKI